MILIRDIMEYLEMKIADHTIRDDEYGLYINYDYEEDSYHNNLGLYQRINNELESLGV